MFVITWEITSLATFTSRWALIGNYRNVHQITIMLDRVASDCVYMQCSVHVQCTWICNEL